MMRIWGYVVLFYFSILTVINASWFSVLNQALQRKTPENPEENNFISPINASYEEAELLRKHLMKEKSLLLEKTKRQLEIEKVREIKDLERNHMNEIENVKEELRRVSSENSRLQVNIDDIKDALLKSESEKEVLQSQLHLSTNAMRQVRLYEILPHCASLMSVVSSC